MWSKKGAALFYYENCDREKKKKKRRILHQKTVAMLISRHVSKGPLTNLIAPGSTTRYLLLLDGILVDPRLPTAFSWPIPIYTPGWRESLSYRDSTCTGQYSHTVLRTVKKSAAKNNYNAKRENMAEKSFFPLTREFQEFLACFSDSSPVNLLQITIFDSFFNSCYLFSNMYWKLY